MTASSYEQRLKDRLDTLELNWQGWLDGNAHSREQLIVNTHQLSGSAALYGYVAMGEAANRMHVLLKSQTGFAELKKAWLQLKNMLTEITTAN